MQAAGTLVLASALAVVLHAVPHPVVAFFLVAVPLTVAAFWLAPFAVLLVLLVYFPLHLWVDAVFLTRIGGAAGALAGISKDLALVALLVVALLQGRHRLALMPGTLVAALMAFSVLLVALGLAGPSVRAAILDVRFHVEYLALIPVVGLLADTGARRRAIILVLLASAAAIAIAWLALLGWTGLGSLGYSAATTRALLGDSAVADAINVFGMYMALMCAVAIGIAAERRGHADRLIYAVLAVLLAWALLSSFSRRSVLGLMIGGVVMVLVSRRWRLALAGAAATAIVVAIASGPLLQRFSAGAADSTGGVSLREQHLRFTLSELDPVTTWIGHGVGTMGFVPMQAGVASAVDLHSYYLILLYESGVLGLGLYLLIVGAAFMQLVRAHGQAAAGSLERGVLLGSTGALTAFVLAGLLGTSNAVLPVAPVQWSLVGLALAFRVRY